MTEHIYSVLVVSSAEKFVKPMLEMLPEKMFDPIMTATDAAQARRKLLENDFDIVIVNSPLKDEFGTRLALDICSKSSAGVLLFVKAEHYDNIREYFTETQDPSLKAAREVLGEEYDWNELRIVLSEIKRLKEI